MKTFKTLTASVLAAIVLSFTAFATAASAKSTMVKIYTTNPDIKKVVIRGNLKVSIVQGRSEWVSLDEEDKGAISIKQIGNTLTLSSSESRPISLTLYVKDIYRIDAANTATVRTVGNFNMKFLQVMLKDNATARIKANTSSIYTVINDHANLELLGTTQKHIAKSEGLAVLNTERFAALETNHESSTMETAMNLDTAGRKSVVKSALK